MNKDNEFTDILRIQGINAKGYGILPKIPMQDQRLTPTAKLIYAYFCTFAGAGEVAFPSANKIMYDLGIKDIDTFRKHRKQLEHCGYIHVEQSTKKGVFCSNIYTLISNTNPEIIDNKQSSPIPKKPVTGKTRNGKNPLPIKPVTKSNSTSKINSMIKNNNSKTKDVVDSIQIKTLVNNFKTKYNADIDSNRTKTLIQLKGIDHVTACIDTYGEYLQGRKVRNIGGDFYTFATDGYTKPVSANNAPTTVPSYANFEQREYTEDMIKPFMLT